MKPLLIGQAPAQHATGNGPLSGRCGEALAALCELDLVQFLADFDRVNLLGRFPGKSGKGDRFPIEVARRRAIDLLMSGTLFDRRVVLLGGNVAKAFGVDYPRPFEWQSRRALVYAVAPHPSGINLWWNDPANRAAARVFWRELASGAEKRPRKRPPAAV